ncbi:hypothetical protein FXO38_14919 [Capsicum annuum]|nr:hypothetical protein FXO38_14919 [Capsicum annuum]
MKSNIVVITNKLEKIVFPPVFFNVMEYLPIHFVHKARLDGPVQTRWMYPFERAIKKLKRGPKNKHRVEGSIVEAYLTRETSQFCSYYFRDEVACSRNRLNCHQDNVNEPYLQPISIFNQSGCLRTGVCWFPNVPLVDDVHIVSVDTLVDPIDDEIDSSCEINLCPPNVEAYMWNGSASSCVMGVDQLVCENCPPVEYVCDVLNRTQVSELFENIGQQSDNEPESSSWGNIVFETLLKLDIDHLESEELACSKSVCEVDHTLFRYNVLFKDDLNTPNEPSGENDAIACLGSYNLYANPLWCDNIPSKEGNLFLEDESTLKGKEYVVAEATSSSTLCDFIVESTHGDYWETSSEYTHESTLVQVDLSDTFLYSLFTLDDIFIQVFGIISKPLTEITKKDKFKWNDTAHKSFMQLKEALTQSPVLAFPDTRKTFIVETDANGYEVVWSQISMDFIDGLPKSQGFKVILVVVDRLSKYGHFMPLSILILLNLLLRCDVQELFNLQGVMLYTSTAYDPQSDGQTEALNRCLETYLRCYCNDDPSAWVTCLPIAEYWYNTCFHSAIQTTPYEVLYGRHPPLHLPYLPGESASTELDTTLINRELKLQLLKHHLLRAQHRMKQQSNAHRSDRSFNVGDWVYFKVQPYRQTTISHYPSHKLAAKYYGLFQIIKSAGLVAYTLLLPSSVKMHPTVYVSLLKKCYAVPSTISLPPIVDLANPNCPTPEDVVQKRLVKKGNKAVAQVLVKWFDLPADVATWEFASVLKTRKLCLYPIGDIEGGGEGHISLCLAITNTQALPLGWEVNLELHPKGYPVDEHNKFALRICFDGTATHTPRVYADYKLTIKNQADGEDVMATASTGLFSGSIFWVWRNPQKLGPVTDISEEFIVNDTLVVTFEITRFFAVKRFA